MDRQRMAAAAAALSAHFGANKAQLVKDVKAVGRYGQVGGLSGKQIGGVIRGSLKRDFVTLSRFQNQSKHNRPQLHSPRGLEMAQSWGRNVAFGGDDRAMLAFPRKAADHTQGYNQSQFVSLTGDVSGLHNSTDDWARRITRGSKQLHEYTIPKRLVRDSARLQSDIGMSGRIASDRTRWFDVPKIIGTAINTWGDSRRQGWLGGVPAQEKEVLFMGGDLGKYRSKKMNNPFKV